MCVYVMILIGVQKVMVLKGVGKDTETVLQTLTPNYPQQRTLFIQPVNLE
jgi:hypothetical protein